MRDFLAWADLQSAEGARVVETVLPETDDDAVRILTIHGAKGLEFPITIVSGTTTQAAGRRGGVQLLFPHDSDTYALKVSARVTTEEFERYEPIDEQMDFHEKLRLLYVALTRARDHLVVSVHRSARPPDPDDRTKWTHAELLWGAAASAPSWEPFTTSPDDDADAATVPDRPTVGETHPSVPPWPEWVAERDRVLAAASVPRVRSATAIARAEAAERRGCRSGAAEGRARPRAAPVEQGEVRHRRRARGARGPADRRSRERLRHRARRGRAGRGRGCDRQGARHRRARALGDRVGRRARSRRRTASTVRCTSQRRSVIACSRATSTWSSGRSNGLVVVDYKTDAWRDDADLADKVARYRLQGASYAVALEAATGEPVARCVFLFLTPDRAVAREVVDLPAAMDAVRAQLGVFA